MPRPREVDATLRFERDAGRETRCDGSTAEVRASENPQPSRGELRPPATSRRPCAVSGRVTSPPATAGRGSWLVSAVAAERGDGPLLLVLLDGLLHPVVARADWAPERCREARGDGCVALPRAESAGGRAVSDDLGPRAAPARSVDLFFDSVTISPLAPACRSLDSLTSLPPKRHGAREGRDSQGGP